jgi:hypothetical protein
MTDNNTEIAAEVKHKADAMDDAKNDIDVSTIAMLKVVNTLADADVVLKVGTREDALEIEASSHVPLLGSPVFKAVLDSPFIEGTTRGLSILRIAACREC